jgi:hypothetical protein
MKPAAEISDLKDVRMVLVSYNFKKMKETNKELDSKSVHYK